MPEGFSLPWDDPYPSQRCKGRAEVQHEGKAFMIYSVPLQGKRKRFLPGRHSQLSLVMQWEDITLTEPERSQSAGSNHHLHED